MEIGYALSSEEHGPDVLLRNARRAEEVGFTLAMMSDHYHPWTDNQGQSSFVWSVLGAVAAQTQLRVGTAVTCPTMRIHPAIIAQAAATMEAMFPGRFQLGVGTGENLNEHILGQRWPSARIRLEMLVEAIGVIRLLWEGGSQSYYGRYYTIENARVYTLPDKAPPILMAAGYPKSARIAGTIADGLVTIEPDAKIVEAFQQGPGANKPKCGQVRVCWAETEEEARRIAKVWSPIAVLKGQVTQELPLPAHFSQATADVTEEQVAEKIVCGPDPEKHVAKISEWREAGFEQVFVHQAGPDQEGFFRFYEREVLPLLARQANRPEAVTA